MNTLKKLKKNSRNTDIQSLTDRIQNRKLKETKLWFKVKNKIEYWVKRVPLVTKRFINHKIQYGYWIVKKTLNWLGFRQSKYYILDIVVTGIIIHVIVVLWHSTSYKSLYVLGILQWWRFISYGLLAAIITYYIKWFRKLQLTKTTYEVDNIDNGTTSNKYN